MFLITVFYIFKKFFKVNNKTLEKDVKQLKLFQVKNKETGMTSMMLLWCLYC